MKKIQDHQLVKIFDVPITAVTVNELLDSIDSYVQNGSKRKIIGYTNLHGIYLSLKVSAMQLFYDKASINYIDGTPVMWIANAIGYKLDYSNRITFLDFTIDFFERCAANSYRVLWIGGEESSLTAGIANIKSQVPNVELTGIDGFKTNDQYLEKIDSVKPNIIILGLGMPKQETWVLNNINSLDVNVVWCVGATIDFLSGKVRTPPRWTGRIGMEWIFRFLDEPKRMFSRYFIEPFIVLYYLVFKRK